MGDMPLKTKASKAKEINFKGVGDGGRSKAKGLRAPANAAGSKMSALAVKPSKKAKPIMS